MQELEATDITRGRESGALGPVFLDLKGRQLADDEIPMLQHPATGGVILFGRNCHSREQVSELVRQIRSVRAGLIIAVDQEGGRVQRLRSGVTRLPPLQTIGTHYRRDAEVGLAAAKACGWIMAAELRAVDIDLSFAPVLDADDGFSEVIGDRSFSKDFAAVTALGRAYIEGMNAAGMSATAKHFPGHGAIRADSHVESAIDHRTLDQVIDSDMRPFAELVNAYQAVMPAHIVFDRIDEHPVGYSSFWLQQILRRRLGFSGVIFSDDLSMAAAACAGDYAERARSALAAGCDAVLVCNCAEGARQVLQDQQEEFARASSRLDRLRARRQMSGGGLAELRQSEQWRACRDLLEDLGVGDAR